MIKLKKFISIFLVFLLFGCSTTKEKQLFEDYTISSGFDTIISYKMYANSENEFKKAIIKANELFSYYNELFDKYNDYEINNIKTINDNAGIQPIEVDQEIINLLLLSKQYSELSNNQFDVTLGSVLKIWHDVREKALNNESYELPSKDELNQAKVCSGWDKVVIDDEKNTVYLTESCASLDVGAVAKGYATQKVSEMLINDGFTNGFINAGGNLEFLGPKINKDAWRTGILAPSLNNSSQSLVVIPLPEQVSFVTSGDYQRYFIHNDEIMHHIIDPDTLYPAKHAKSITILTKDSGIADILSTTLYTMTYQEGLQLIEKLKLNGLEVDAVWIYDNLNEIKNESYTIKENFYLLSSNIELIK